MTSNSFQWAVPDTWIERLPALEGQLLVDDHEFVLPEINDPFEFSFMPRDKKEAGYPFVISTNAQALSFSENERKIGFTIPS